FQAEDGIRDLTVAGVQTCALPISIVGVPSDAWPHDYPDVASRFERYHEWVDHPAVCAVTYEHLMGDERTDTLRRMVDFWAERSKIGRASCREGVRVGGVAAAVQEI